MKKYLAPDVEMLAWAADVIMASGDVVVPGDGYTIPGSSNQTPQDDFISDLVLGDIENI